MDYNDFLKIFGNNLRILRRRANMTQEQVAEMLNLNPKHLSEIERGYKGTSFHVVFALSQLFQVSVESLFHDSSSSSDIDLIIEKLNKRMSEVAEEVSVDLRNMKNDT